MFGKEKAKFNYSSDALYSDALYFLLFRGLVFMQFLVYAFSVYVSHFDLSLLSPHVCIDILNRNHEVFMYLVSNSDLIIFKITKI